MSNRMVKIHWMISSALMVGLMLATIQAHAFEGRFLAKEDIILYGMRLNVEQATQTVPKNIATIVSTYLQTPTLPSGQVPPLPSDAVVKATLRGPGLEKPLDLAVMGNTPFNIPPLVTPGTYSLDNIRLESGGEVMLRGNPESVTIEVIEKLLVTQVTARPLTAAEIREKGIVYDKSNFQAYNFTAAFAVESGKEIKLDMPVLLPLLASTQEVSVPTAGIGALAEAQLKGVATIIPDSLKLAQTKIPNLTVTGFSLKMDKYEGSTFVVPPIPGVVVIPGDIGFLNQYFSVMLMVGNVAPLDSNLVVKDLRAEIFLPSGKDNVAGSSDDPLMMAMTGTGEAPRIRAVVQPGPDAKLGTDDDIVSLAPGETGNAEYLVEGRREGSHTVEMEITGTLYGLPIGPVTVRGRAAGTVLVRNPTFTMTFTHPDIVAAGEEYTLDVTVTNTSDSPANFVSINLYQNQIGGADLVDPSQPNRQIETIPPGDSASVSFDLRSKVSGKVFAATLDSGEQVSGRFQLKTSVGELGIPLSPDSLVLPKESRFLPKSLRDAALGMLGKAYAVATAPAAALPRDVRRFGKKIVWTRGIEVAQAGFRVSLGQVQSPTDPPLGEPVADTAKQLLFDFMGSNYGRLPEQFAKPEELAFERDDFTGFDELRRRSVRGDVLADAVASLLSPDFLSMGGGEFQRDFSSKTAYRPPQVSVVLDGMGAAPPVTMSLIDPTGRVLGGIGEKGKVVKEIPFSDYLTIKDAGQRRGEAAIVSLPSAGAHKIRLTRIPGAVDAPFSLSLVAPDDKGVLQQRVFSGITIDDLPVIELPSGSPATFTVELFSDGEVQDGTVAQPTVSRAIPDPLPTVISVVQQPDADKVENFCGVWRFGRIVAALFSEEVTPASVQDRLAKAQITNYSLEDNQVVGVALQPGNRVAFIALRDPIGPFVERSLTFDGVADRLGQSINGQAVPIRATIVDPAAVVSGTVLNPDGTPLEGAEVRLFHQIEVLTEDGCMSSWYGISDKFTKTGAKYGWDYVLKGTNKIVALDAASDDFREILFTPARNGQRLNVDIVMLGRGIVRGKVLGEDGATPLRDATIRITSLTDNSQYGFTTDATGTFVMPRVPVGNFLVEAVHLPTNSKVVQSGYIGEAGGTVEMNLILFTEAVRKITIKYASINGHVLRHDGATPAASVPVYAYYQNNSQDGVLCPGYPIPPECAVATANTDSSGSYSLPEIPAGSYRIYTFDQATFQEGNARTIVAADQTASANILLSGGFGTISGIVRDAGGNPVADAEVGGGVTLTRTGSDGRFTLTDVPVGRRTLVAVSQSLGAKGEAVVDVSLPGVEYPATIVLEAQGGIFGTVRTSGGSAAANLDVYLIGSCESGPCVIGTAVTNALGAYTINNVPAGAAEYTVSAFLPDLSDGNVVPVKVLFAGQKLRADVTFKGGGGTVTGGIWNANGNTPLAGKVSISALRVVSATVGGKRIGLRFEYTQHLQIVDTTIENNQFTFNNVPVGPFVITAAGPFSPEPVTFAGEITESGQTKVVNINLSPTSVVTGVVYGPDGATPVVNAVVNFKSDEFRTICADTDPLSAVSQSGGTVTVDLDALSGDQKCEAIPQGIQALDTRTDAQGRFTFPLVNAGKFTISVEERDNLDVPTGRTGKITSTVAPGKMTELSFRLNVRAPVKVTVFTHGATARVPNAKIKIEQSSRIGDTTRPVYTADANGELMLNGSDALDEGSFTVLAESNDGFAGRGSGKIVTDGTLVEVRVYLFDQTVTVKGVVYRQDGITPVRNAEVSIANNSGDLAFAVTNANGEYSQEYIPLGDFRIAVFEAATGRRGFATATAYLTTPIVTVNIREMPIGLVKGTVYQGGGDLQPLARWIVTLRQSYPSGRGLAIQATTGVDGRFSFPGVAAGPFTITASREGQSSIAASGNLSREGEIIDIPMIANLAKPQSGSIFGWVYLANGQPAPDTAVCTGLGCSVKTTADSDGKFVFDNMPLGRFAVYAANQVNAERGSGYGEIPYAGGTGYVKVVMEGLGTVSGTVVDGITPVPGAKVTLVKYPDAGCGTPECQAFADVATGAFSFLNVPAGPFRVYASDPAAPQRHGSGGGILNPGGTAQITVAFADTAILKLKVLYANGTVAPSVVVELKRDDNLITLYGETDNNGLITLNAVPKGSYGIALQDPASQGLARMSLQIAADTDLSGVPTILDEAPPEVKGSVPMPGEIRVLLDAKISITFSEPVQPGSIDSSTINVASIDGPVDGFISLQTGDTVATFTPLKPLKDERQFTVRVSGVKDRVDRLMVKDYVTNFTTVDITPPSVASLSPDPANSTGVPLESVVRIQFSEPFDPTAFTGPAIAMTGPAGAVEGRVDAILGNTGLVFTPKYPLQPGASYTIAILPAADLSGNRRQSGENFTITTSDRTPPKIIGLASSKNGVPVSSVIENDTIDIVPTIAGNNDIAMIDWYLNGQPAQTARTAPFGFSFKAISLLGRPGDQIRVTAVATDTSGNRGTDSDSFSMLITVAPDLSPTVTVSVVDPASGSQAGNCIRVALQVQASDDIGVSRIGYQAVGGVGLSDCQPQPGIPPATGAMDLAVPEQSPLAVPFAFYVPRTAAPGSQIIVNATAVDSKGQVSKAVPVVVTVLDNIPPSVSFAGLSSGETVKPGQKITAVVAASDVGGVARLSFRANGALVDDRAIAPAMNNTAATFNWTVPAGFTTQDLVRLEVTAYDAAGNSADAPSVILPIADTMPPQVSIRTANNSTEMYPGQPLTIVVTAQDDSIVSSVALSGSGAFSFSDGAVFPPSGSVEKSFTVDVPAGIGNGAQLTVSAMATDASNNTSTPVSLILTARVLQAVQLPSSQLIAAGETESISATLAQPAPAGGITIELVATGSIQVQPSLLVFAEGETSKSFTLAAVAGGSASVSAQVGGATVSSMTVTVRGGIVSGTVVNGSAQPVSGAQVVINGTTYTSAVDGSFFAEGISGTTVVITAFDTVNKLQGYLKDTMNQVGGYLRNLTVLVSEAGTVKGLVKLANGNPAPEGVNVYLYEPIDLLRPLMTASTAVDGSFSFPQVQLGTYALVAADTAGNRGRSTAYLTVSGAEVPVTITFLGKGTISGVVRDASGGGVSGLTISMNNSHLFGSDSATTASSAEGAFTFTGVTVGSFSLSTKDSVSGYGSSTSGTISADGQTINATLTLSAYGSVEGHVYRYDGTTPAAGVTVRAAGLTTTTSEQGYYRFEVLPLGYQSISVDDPEARAKAQATAQIQSHEQNVTTNLNLSGTASVAVTVLDSSQNPVNGARISLSDGYGALSGTSDASGVLVFSHVYAGNFTVSAVRESLHGTLSATVTDGGQLEVFVTVLADPAASVTGMVYQPDGLTPASGVTVALMTPDCKSGSWSCRSTSMKTDGDGGFTFAAQKLDTYELYVRDANGQLRAKSMDIVLTSDGQTEQRNLTMVGLGTVNGRVYMPNSSSGAPNMAVTVQGKNPDFGVTTTVRTNAGGYYQVERIPVGNIAVTSGDIGQMLLGETSGALSADGAILTLDVALLSNAVNMPQTLKDGNLQQFDIQGNGTVLYGQENVFYSSNSTDPRGAALEIVSSGSSIKFPTLTAGTKEMLGRQLALKSAGTFDGLNVTRKVYVPQEGYFARYLELVENPTAVAKSITVKVRSSFNNSTYSYYCGWWSTCYTGLYNFSVNSTSSGNNALDPGQNGDLWAVIDNTTNSSYYSPLSTRIAQVWGGQGARVAIAALELTPWQNYNNTYSGASLSNSWDITVQPGERIALMHFMVQEPSVDGAKAAAQRLVQLPPEALAGLGQDEILAIRNFTVPLDGSSTLTSLPPLTGTVNINLKDGTGAPAVGQMLNLTLKSSNPVFGKAYTSNNQICTYDWWYGYVCTYTSQVSLVSNLSSTSPSIGIPLGPFSVTASRTVGGLTVEGTVTGDFASGSSTTDVNLQFVNSGSLSGATRYSNGTLVANGTVNLLSSGSSILNMAVSGGAYAMQLLPVGDFTVQLCVPSPSGGTSSCTTSPVTIVAGQNTLLDLTLPPLGTIRGRLISWNGSPLINRSVYLNGTASMNGFSRSAYTDSSGGFVFAEVQPGTYELSAVDPSNSSITKKITVNMSDGQDITQDISFSKSGSIKLTTLFADGTALSNYTGTIEVTEQPGDAVAYSNSSFYPDGTTSSFSSDASNFRVRYSYPYSQPNGYGATATGEVTIAGFTTSGGTALPATISFAVNRANLLLTPIGSDGLPVKSTSVTMQVVDPADNTKVWGYCYTSSYGSCTLYDVWDSGAGVKVRALLNNSVAAETVVTINTSTSVNVNLQLPFDPVIFKKTLYDGNGSRFDVMANGSIRYGLNYVFEQYNSSTPGAMALTVGGTAYSGPSDSIGVMEDGGRELVSRQNGIAGLNVTRKTFVPADGYFTRYLDIFTNQGDTDLTVDLSMDTRFYYDQYYYSSYDFAVRAASDSTIADSSSINRSLTGTTWAVIDDSNAQSNMPAVALVYADTVERAPAAADFFTLVSRYDTSRVSTKFQSVTVPAGKSVALLNFLVQQTTRDAATASAQRLAQLPPEALSGLSSEERLMVINFAVPADGVSTVAPLPPMDGSVTGTIRDYAGQLPTTPNNGSGISLKSSLPYYPQELTRSADSSTGIFSFVSNNYEGSSRRLIPRAPFILKGSFYNNSFTVISDPVAGTFADGETTAQQDITFATSATIVATLTRFDGTAAVGARVYASNATGSSHDFAEIGNGVYRRNFFPAGDYTINVELPAPTPSNGTKIMMTGQLSVVAGQENGISLSFPQLGSIGGTVRNYSGLPVSGNSVTIKSTTKNFTRSLNTYNGSNGGPSGTFAFNDLPPDTYQVLVRDMSNYFDYPFTVTIAAGETISRDFQYTAYGTVTGKVAYRTPIAGYYPTYVNIEVREAGSGKVITSTSSSSESFTTSRFAAPEPGKQYELRAWYTYVYNSKTAQVIVPLSSFTSANQQINIGTVSLPFDRGNITVEVKDRTNTTFTKQVRVELRESDGTVINSNYFTGSYTFNNIYSGESTLTARVIYNGINYDAPVTLVPNGTATVTVTMPIFDGTLSGTLTTAAGTALQGGQYYSLFRADGTQMACGQEYYYNYYYYEYMLRDTYECYSYDGTFRLQDYNGNLRANPFSEGEQLRMHVRSWALGDFDQNFSYPVGTSTASVQIALPVFEARGVVRRADGSALGNASLTMTVSDLLEPELVFTYSGYTEADGSYVIMGSKGGNFTITAQTSGSASGAVSGVVSDFDIPLNGLDIVIEPTGSVSGYVMRNGTPVYDARVTLSIPDRNLSVYSYSNADGWFSFVEVPHSLFTISASTQGESDNFYTNSFSGELTSDVSSINDIQLVFSLLPGTIWGTVRDDQGNTIDWRTVTVTRVSDGAITYAYTGSSGYFQLDNMPADNYLAEAYAWGSEENRISGSVHGVLADGATLMLDLYLKPAVDISYNYSLLPGGGLFDYTASYGGALTNGWNATYSSPFNSYNYLHESVSGVDFQSDYGWLDGSGQIVLQPQAINGKIYSRKLYMQPQGDFLRYLEIIENPSSAVITDQPQVYGNLATPAAGAWSYEVDPSTTGNQYVIEAAQDDAQMPKVGIVLQGDFAGDNPAPVFTYNSTEAVPEWGWTVDLPAGGKSCIMHFIFQGEPGDTTMATKAQLLRDLSFDGNLVKTDPLLGLTQEDRDCIRNFSVPVQ